MSLELPTRRKRPEQLDPEDRLFRHSTRPEWGIGVWMREEATRRRLRFEDGVLRAFKKGYYHFLRPVDSEKVDIDEVFERVVGEHADAVDLDGRDGDAPVMPFGRQVEVFLHLYPKGFSDPAYQKTWGTDASSKSNLPATSEAMKTLLDQPDDTVLGQQVGELLCSTILVSKGRAEPLLADPAALGAAVRELIHGEARFGRRFAVWLTWLEAHANDVDWRLATVIPGLVHPQKHVVTRRQVMQLQGRSTTPSKIPKKPSLAGYRRSRRIARATRDKLVATGLEPRSMLDVHAFVWETLRPKGQKLAEEGW